MSGWTNAELDLIAAPNEMRIASRREDGDLTKPVTIWMVRHDDRFFVRSVNGPGAGWYRSTLVRRTGHIWAGGIDRDVSFAEADHEVDAAIDAAYRGKYSYASAATLDRITSDEARSTTTEICPA